MRTIGLHHFAYLQAITEHKAVQVIFNPLVQIETLPTQQHDRPSTSLGLGLSIAHEIVTRHGGRRHVTSSAVDGTAFVVQLQAQPPVLSPAHSED